MNDIKEFCEKHGACNEGREWALANCADMAEAWDKLKPEWLIWVATRGGVMDRKTLILFSCWCVRRIWGLLKDERSKNAIRVAERFTKGKATRKEFAAAWSAAWDAAGDAAWAAAGAAARAAAGDAAMAAAGAAARAAAGDAAWAAAGDAQAKKLRSYGNPFKK